MVSVSVGTLMEADDILAYNAEHATDVRDVSGSDIDRVLHGVKMV